MRFLVDRCAGHRLAEWLRANAHDVVESRERGPDPGDFTLLGWAANEGRILVTIDADFGKLIFVDKRPHWGIVRLPDVPAAARIALMKDVLDRHEKELAGRAIITVRGNKIRVSMPARAEDEEKQDDGPTPPAPQTPTS
jgi:predicted nuclease of predicted toxin-antitoxin system